MAALLLLAPASALAKKKHKKPKGLGPVVTATAVGNTVEAPARSPLPPPSAPPGSRPSVAAS